MEEIYWITRLDGINIFLNVTMVFGMIFTIIFAGGYIITKNIDNVDDCWKELWIKLFKYCFPTTIIVSLLFILTPTTKEALTIWEVGGTIDYIKENKTARQLPNKCIEALDKWVDSLTEDNKNKY